MQNLQAMPGLPAGVFNVITGDADVIGKSCCEDFRLWKLSFTGSTNVGKFYIKMPKIL
ncbi:hypothetical protein KNCP2_08310 [Candidatus Rickettsia kedanie]|uniref:Aldehyde dehydrogenase domain-containing protein n=1 Tax=Candidatus Rickettsia kedanie TaxID=3115352 RepID=A0ABP9TW68_9RICK